MSPTLIKGPMRWFVLAAFVFFVGYFSWTALHTRTFGGSSLVELELAFSSIEPPVNARQSGEVRRSSKVTVQAVYANYMVPSNNVEVMRHYQVHLADGGWRLISSDERILKFCKGDMDATLEFIEATVGGGRYYFGVTREDGPARRTGC